MKDYLRLRSLMVLGVIAIFAYAMHPLKPLDFYDTFRASLQDGVGKLQGEKLIAEAERAQAEKKDLYPATALLQAADKNNIELNEITTFSTAHDNSEVVSLVRKEASSSIRLGLDLNGGVEFILGLNPDEDALAANGISREEANRKLSENFNEYRDLAMEALRKRLEKQNIFECEITPFAERSLALRAPIVSRDEKDKLQKLIQMSSKLEFRLVHENSQRIIDNKERIPLGYEKMQEAGSRRGEETSYYIVQKRSLMNGNAVDKAHVAQNEYGAISIALKFNSQGAAEFAEITGKNLHRQLAIVLDGKLYCAPVIQSRISGGQAEITGKFSMEEAQNIADALNSGSFPFRIDVQAVYDTDPTLGSDNVKNGIYAGLIALLLLAVFMIVYYRLAGVIAVAALVVNVVLILGAMATFDATLTMPGIAGIILTLGMAVDANVLVFERMREEFDQGKNSLSVVNNGFKQAYSAVLDGNLTTLVVALILMYFGTGAVKGFAVSLAIGIVASLFTALFMSRVLFDWLLTFKPDIKLGMLRFFSNPRLPFLKQSRWAVVLSLVLIVFSFVMFAIKGRNALSVDFTGGTLLSYNYTEQVPVSDLETFLLENKLPCKVSYKSSASQNDNRKVEILLREGWDSEFAAGSEGAGEAVRQLLENQYPQLQLRDVSVTQVGAMVGNTMTRNAVISLLLAFVGMIVYVSLRYEFNYAVAGILALVHDCIISLGIFVLLGREISLPVVAGVLTIIGYSINDTIVIFDRIREEKKLHPEREFEVIVDESLNRTLSRTVLTSLTTLLVVMVMLITGGIAISDFMLIMALGIVVGSYSSLYIASPVIVFYRRLKNKRKSKAVPEVEVIPAGEK
ncbi:MAG: protein translocase subunit SecD [Lentisphaerae bacterium]|nr:protein translocase subunit SecD [Lentisphaerota bacterium]